MKLIPISSIVLSLMLSAADSSAQPIQMRAKEYDVSAKIEFAVDLTVLQRRILFSTGYQEGLEFDRKSGATATYINTKSALGRFPRRYSGTIRSINTSGTSIIIEILEEQTMEFRDTPRVHFSHVKIYTFQRSTNTCSASLQELPKTQRCEDTINAQCKTHATEYHPLSGNSIVSCEVKRPQTVVSP